MNLARSCWLIGSLALTACASEVVELVRYDVDAAQENEAGTSDGEPETDGELRRDAGSNSDLDARVKPGFAEFDAGAQRTCSSNDECGKDGKDYCSMTSCNAKHGVCMPRVTVCSADQSLFPICGCDGVKYFNDCLRTRQGVNVDPTCTLPRVCSNSSPCPDYADCGNVFHDCSCRQTAERVCWVLPTKCPPSTVGGDQFVSCDVAATGVVDFVNACEAIQSQAPYLQLTRACTPPRTGSSGNDLMP